MSARPGLCGGHRATGVPTAIASYDDPMTSEREGLLEKLVVSLHLSVPERQMIGAPPFRLMRSLLL